MDVREKLAELLADAPYNIYGDRLGVCFFKSGLEITAGYLMARGVTAVVRCKDCKWLYDDMDDYCCRSHRGLVRICENSFCSYGERKEDK